MQLPSLPLESYRLLQLGFFYVLGAFALAGVRARMQKPIPAAREEADMALGNGFPTSAGTEQPASAS